MTTETPNGYYFQPHRSTTFAAYVRGADGRGRYVGEFPTAETAERAIDHAAEGDTESECCPPIPEDVAAANLEALARLVAEGAARQAGEAGARIDHLSRLATTPAETVYRLPVYQGDENLQQLADEIAFDELARQIAQRAMASHADHWNSCRVGECSGHYHHDGRGNLYCSPTVLADRCPCSPLDELEDWLTTGPRRYSTEHGYLEPVPPLDMTKAHPCGECLSRYADPADAQPDERARLIRARDEAHATTMRELRELAVIAPASIVWRIAR